MTTDCALARRFKGGEMMATQGEIRTLHRILKFLGFSDEDILKIILVMEGEDFETISHLKDIAQRT